VSKGVLWVMVRVAARRRMVEGFILANLEACDEVARTRCDIKRGFGYEMMDGKMKVEIYICSTNCLATSESSQSLLIFAALKKYGATLTMQCQENNLPSSSSRI
jgi:hypothetical protein